MPKIFFLFFSGMALFHCAHPRITMSGKIYEEIIDVTQIKPIVGAKVELINIENNIHMEDFSSNDGSYLFEYPVSGQIDENGNVKSYELPFTIRITKTGFEETIIYTKGYLARTIENDYYLIKTK